VPAVHCASFLLCFLVWEMAVPLLLQLQVLVCFQEHLSRPCSRPHAPPLPHLQGLDQGDVALYLTQLQAQFTHPPLSADVATSARERGDADSDVDAASEDDGAAPGGVAPPHDAVEKARSAVAFRMCAAAALPGADAGEPTRVAKFLAAAAFFNVGEKSKQVAGLPRCFGGMLSSGGRRLKMWMVWAGLTVILWHGVVCSNCEKIEQV
jgi:hypothetical protein